MPASTPPRRLPGRAFNLSLVRRCIFRENAGHTGGACLIQGAITIDDCDFIANSAVYGGGLEISSGPSVVVIRSRFTRNSATEEAGGFRAAVGDDRDDPDEADEADAARQATKSLYLR